MKSLSAPTEESIKLERTRLAADAAAGRNVTLTLENNDGFAAERLCRHRHEGSELAELEQINQAVSGATAVRVATLKFNHQTGEPVTCLSLQSAQILWRAHRRTAATPS